MTGLKLFLTLLIFCHHFTHSKENEEVNNIINNESVCEKEENCLKPKDDILGKTHKSINSRLKNRLNNLTNCLKKVVALKKNTYQSYGCLTKVA
jgi:hypothetical protein